MFPLCSWSWVPWKNPVSHEEKGTCLPCNSPASHWLEWLNHCNHAFPIFLTPSTDPFTATLQYDHLFGTFALSSHYPPNVSVRITTINTEFNQSTRIITAKALGEQGPSGVQFLLREVNWPVFLYKKENSLTILCISINKAITPFMKHILSNWFPLK